MLNNEVEWGLGDERSIQKSPWGNPNSHDPEPLYFVLLEVDRVTRNMDKDGHDYQTVRPIPEKYLIREEEI